MRGKKAIFLAWFAAAVLLSFSSCKGSDAEVPVPDGFFLAENETADFYFFYPQSWTLDRNDGMISAYAGASDASNVSVTAFHQPQTATPEEYFDGEYLRYLGETFPNLRTVAEKERLSVGGREAIGYTFSNVFSETEYLFRQILVARDDTIYLITYTARAEVYDTHLELVNGMISEFQFKE